MIYTKMMDSLNEEEIPQEAAVEQPVEPAADIEEVTVEEVEDFNDGLVEGAKIDSEIKIESMKFDKSFSILSHVRKYGVDRSFLNICNSDNRLATDLGIVLPASEDFEIYGSPNSNVSKRVIAAMESGDSLWSRFWEWIKGIASKLWNWVKSFFVKAWEFIKKLLGIGTSKLEKISDITQALKKQGVRTIEVNEDFMNLNDRLKDSILERQDKMIRRREFLNSIKGLVSDSYKCIKDVMSRRNVERRVEDLEAITRKLKEYSGNVWDTTKTVVSEGSNAVGNVASTGSRILDKIGNSLSEGWDSVVDAARSAEYSIDRYHKKTVREQARREYKDARNKRDDALSDWMGATYENVSKEGTFNNDTRFTYKTNPWNPNPHPIRSSSYQHNTSSSYSNTHAQAAPVKPTTSAAQAAPVKPTPTAANSAQPNVNNNNRSTQAQAAPVSPTTSGSPNQARVTPSAANNVQSITNGGNTQSAIGNNAQPSAITNNRSTQAIGNNAQNATNLPSVPVQRTPINQLESRIRDAIRLMFETEKDSEMQERIQNELMRMTGDFMQVVKNLRSPNSPTDDAVFRSVRETAMTVVEILTNLRHDFEEATKNGVVLSREMLAVYDETLFTLTAFTHNGVNAASTLIYTNVLYLQNVKVDVGDVAGATFDPAAVANNRGDSILVQARFDRSNRMYPVEVSSWDVHVPVGVQAGPVTRLVAHCRLDAIIGKGNSRDEYYFVFGKRDAPVRIYYYIPTDRLPNRPTPGSQLPLGAPTQTTVTFTNT